MQKSSQVQVCCWSSLTTLPWDYISLFQSCVPSHTHGYTHTSAITLLFSQKSVLFLLVLTKCKESGREWDTEIRNQTQGRHQHFQKYTTRKTYPNIIPSHKVANDLEERTLGYVFYCVAHTWVLSESYMQLNTVLEFVWIYFHCTTMERHFCNDLLEEKITKIKL